MHTEYEEDIDELYERDLNERYEEYMNKQYEKDMERQHTLYQIKNTPTPKIPANKIVEVSATKGETKTFKTLKPALKYICELPIVKETDDIETMQFWLINGMKEIEENRTESIAIVLPIKQKDPINSNDEYDYVHITVKIKE